MKSIFIFFAFFIASTLFAQSSWRDLEKELYNQKFTGKITQKEFYKRVQIEAGSTFRKVKAWYRGVESINKTDSEKIELKLFSKSLNPQNTIFSHDSLVLYNYTSDTLKVKRHDATVGAIEEYFEIDGEWIIGQKGFTRGSCGNGRFVQKLHPYTSLSMKLSRFPLYEGSNLVNYKIVLTLADQTVESNVVKVKLTKNQILRILDENPNKQNTIVAHLVY